MKKINKNVEMFYQNISNKTKKSRGFTLVELLVVITILAILATIAFTSFKSYSSNARDGARLSALNNIQKGLELFQITSGTLPLPEGQINTGILNGETLTYVGNIGENITRIIKLSSIPLDPLSGKNYVYGISADKKYYQIATTTENYTAYTNPIIDITYADGGQMAKVVGNYKYPLKLGTKIYSLPSLIYVGSGSITDNSTGFIVNSGENLPYSLDSKPLLNTKTSVDVLKQVTGTSATLSVTGITIPTLTNQEFKVLTSTSTILQTLQQTLGIVNQDELGQLIYGKNYFTNDTIGVSIGGGTTPIETPTNSCSSTQPVCSPTGCTLTTGTPTSQNQAWVKDASSCGFSCNANYSGLNCETYTPPVTTWQQQDSNCTISTDVTVSGTNLSGNAITQVWAPCNSTLGTGIEYSVNQNCYNYEGQLTTGCNRSSNEKENVYNATYGVNNIWGKLYTWANAPSACPTGRHLPSQLEWTILLKNLTCSDYVNETTTGWLCSGLGWSGNTGKNTTNNIVQALKIPLAGLRNTDGVTFSSRGNSTYFWSSSEYDSTNARGVYLNRSNATVLRNNRNKTSAFSVRCLKD